MTTVGPYVLYGSKLVAACVTAGVHCCDLTGETLWVKDMIDKHHEEAERTGAKIVPSCGFDSIPAVRRTLACCRAGMMPRNRYKFAWQPRERCPVNTQFRDREGQPSP